MKINRGGVLLTGKIAVFGAFDRFNYGDLLFPIVIKKVMESYRINWDIEYYGLKESDLSQYGGVKTHSIKRLFNENNLPNGSILIIAGGEVLSANWVSMHMYLVSSIKRNYLYLISKIVGENISNKLSRFILGSKIEMPWIISSSDFMSEVKVIYNSVGGSNLASCSEYYQKVIQNKLSKAAFLSVRDKKTKNSLDYLDLNNNVELAPDSAILISEFFPITELETKISIETHKIINSFPNGYLCFQSNRHVVKNKEHLIANELTKIHKEFGYGVLLLPIGRATGHEDQVALKKIQNLLTIPSILPQENSIYDIMMLIAKSEIFAGTSLHGNITALSFGVPHVGLIISHPKLEAFLNAWDIEGQTDCVPYEQLFLKVRDVIKIPKEIRIKKRNELVIKCYDNFSKIIDVSQLVVK